MEELALRIGVKSEVVFSPCSRVHGKCIGTVATRTEESDFKKIIKRDFNYAYYGAEEKARVSEEDISKGVQIMEFTFKE